MPIAKKTIAQNNPQKFPATIMPKAFNNRNKPKTINTIAKNIFLFL
jgi:hypothetical protein